MIKYSRFSLRNVQSKYQEHLIYFPKANSKDKFSSCTVLIKFQYMKHIAVVFSLLILIIPVGEVTFPTKVFT